MKILFTSNSIPQYDRILTASEVSGRLLSFAYFMNNPSLDLAKYAEHGSFETGAGPHTEEKEDEHE